MRPGVPVILAALVPGAGAPAAAATLAAGPGERFANPSAAIAAAQPGDVVRIAPGTYYDCAVWSTDRLTIEGGGAVLSDRACQGKAAFVIGGNATVRDLTFTHLRVPDRNGAGIRLEHGNLLVERCTFDDDEAGIIVGQGSPDAIVVVRDSVFHRVGVPGDTLPAISIGTIGLLSVKDSRFEDARGQGIAVRSASPLDISGGLFQAGPGDAPIVDATSLLDVSGATFKLDGERLAAMRSTGEQVAIRGTTLDNHAGTPQTLLLDFSVKGAMTAGNHVAPGDTEVTRGGLWSFRLRGAAHVTIDTLRHLAGQLRRAVRS